MSLLFGVLRSASWSTSTSKIMRWGSNPLFSSPANWIGDVIGSSSQRFSIIDPILFELVSARYRLLKK